MTQKEFKILYHCLSIKMFSFFYIPAVILFSINYLEFSSSYYTDFIFFDFLIFPFSYPPLFSFLSSSIIFFVIFHFSYFSYFLRFFFFFFFLTLTWSILEHSSQSFYHAKPPNGSKYSLVDSRKIKLLNLVDLFCPGVCRQIIISNIISKVFKLSYLPSISEL